jgi:hypothetical protein
MVRQQQPINPAGDERQGRAAPFKSREERIFELDTEIYIASASLLKAAGVKSMRKIFEDRALFERHANEIAELSALVFKRSVLLGAGGGEEQ